MRRIALVSLLIMLLAACGSKPTESTSGAQFTEPPGKAKTPKAPGAGPSTTVKNQPDCKAYQAFSFAASGFALSSPAKKPEALKAVETTGTALKAANGQLATQVDGMLDTMRKTAAGKSTPQDQANYKTQSESLTSWLKSNCL